MNTPNPIKIAGILVYFFMLSSYSVAEPVQFRFTGEIGAVQQGGFFNGAPRVGDPVEGLFSYDIASPITDLPGDIDAYIQTIDQTLSVDINGVQYNAQSSFVVTVQNYETNPGVRNISIVVSDGFTASAAGTALSRLMPPLTGEQILVDDESITGSIVLGFTAWGIVSADESTALPEELFLSSFQFASGEIVVMPVDALGRLSIAEIVFSIDSLSQIPEPGSGCLLLCFLASVSSACRRRA